MKLTHLGISHFRSIGETPVMIDLSKKITVLVGQNDCGKSNVLRAMEWINEMGHSDKVRAAQEIDKHKRIPNSEPLAHLVGQPDTKENEELRSVGRFMVRGPIRKNFEGGALSPEIDELETGKFYRLAKHFGLGSSFMHPNDAETKKLKREVALFIAKPMPILLAKFFLVPQYRRIESGAGSLIAGRGITKLLGSWQNPALNKRHERARFDQIVQLLRSLLNREKVELDVPRGESEIIVSENGQDLPLESHGTGIHQLIILAIAALSEDNALFGIEEPEIHLHPVLQRRFLKFLREETGNNRYIITTHSQTMIAPAEDVDVIHLKMVDSVTIPTRVTTDAHALEALEDLGIRASDLLQANSVIWVEGPSDRIYLKRWMELVNQELGGPELIEGIDYSIMFYGGRLLSHVTLERDETVLLDVNHFVQLLRINQRSAIMMDCDRSNSLEDPINTTKKRIIDECERHGLHHWLTDGREIENYLTTGTVEAAVKAIGITIDDRRFKVTRFQSFNEAFKKLTGTKTDYAANKVLWAHRLVKHIELQDITPELKKQVTKLIQFIRRHPASTPAPVA